MTDSPKPLQDYLAGQLGGLGLTGEQLRLALHVLSFLDWTGYIGRRGTEGEFLPIPLSEIASTFTPPTTTAAVEQVLRPIQQLDPPGVGARDLRECLLLQVTDRTPHRELVRRVIHDHLEEVAHNQLAVVCEKTGVGLGRIKEVLGVLRHLHPKPGLKVRGEARAGETDTE